MRRKKFHVQWICYYSGVVHKFLAKSVSTLWYNYGLWIVFSRLFFRSIEVTSYVYVWENYRLCSLPWDSPWTWYLTFIGVDFGYYWFHRMAHGKEVLLIIYIDLCWVCGRYSVNLRWPLRWISNVVRFRAYKIQFAIWKHFPRMCEVRAQLTSQVTKSSP